MEDSLVGANQTEAKRDKSIGKTEKSIKEIKGIWKKV